jgi:hypothetical protein
VPATWRRVSTGVSLHDANTIYLWINRVDRLEKQLTGETQQDTRHAAPQTHPEPQSLQDATKKASCTHTPTTRPGVRELERVRTRQ